jgi:hypothetical protein
VYNETSLDTLVGETLSDVVEVKSGQIACKFYTQSGKIFKLAGGIPGSSIDTVVGDASNLIDTPITSIDKSNDIGINEDGTWSLTTFRLNTASHTLIISWIGQIVDDGDVSVRLYEYGE